MDFEKVYEKGQWRRKFQRQIYDDSVTIGGSHHHHGVPHPLGYLAHWSIWPKIVPEVTNLSLNVGQQFSDQIEKF